MRPTQLPTSRQIHYVVLPILLLTFQFWNSTTVLGQPPVPYVVVAKVSERPIAEGRNYVGTVYPTKTATVGSAVDGRVIDFPVNEGDRVQAKQPLAQMLTETISKELDAAKALLKLREAELLELKNGTRDLEVEQSRADLEVKRAVKEFNDKRLARFRRLYETNSAVSEDQLQEVVSQAKGAVEEFQRAKATYDMAVEGPRKERILQAEARLGEQEAIVAQIEDRIRKYTVISRFDGYVTEEFTEQGAWLSRGDPVATIVALDEVDILVNVVEDDVASLKHGTPARIEVPSMPDSLWTGHVENIVPSADARSRTFPVKVRVKNKFDGNIPRLKAGLFARVELSIGEKRKTTLVPKDAIVLGGPTPMVWAVTPDGDGSKGTGSVQAVPVRLGVASGDWVGVQGELQNNSLVVVRGNERIFPPRPDQPSLIRWNPSETMSLPAVSNNKAN
ncbi:efflux RND transporter periplasmic adaptor subunit [Calycomorphotria hydatis]|uniref:Multidrug resistance protein MdtA n=1 Tax=Calycomorphotria hydatis TaxID=2528027 RepID=A0A517TB62_9PLAN|nr:efflux RND transporter periplasmic adaptor subunit [Calycomorphotria hydatis]QDT65607.1 Multidrug resistance protein MdtA precursor [Calycomorphotria hydatis]